MNRIRQAFADHTALIPFLTAGDPNLEKTAEYIAVLEKAGADIIEIGIPFSDPIAEGPVIQAADTRSLANGTSVKDIFALVRKVRQTSSIPLVLMTYANPVFYYGYDAFFEEAAKAGADGIIIPDMPLEEREEAAVPAAKQGITMISMAAPNSDSRLQAIASGAEGFVYAVSSAGVTGMRDTITTDIQQFTASIRRYTETPVAVGFGIHTPEQAKEIGRYADGVIVGSGIVQIIAEHGTEAAEPLFQYVSSLRAALDEIEK